MRFVIVIIGLLLLWLWMMTPAAAEDWRSQYRNEHGVSCCGELDCVPAQTTLLSDPAGAVTATVLVTVLEPRPGGALWRHTIMELPMGRVHRSEEPIGYWCHRPGSHAVPWGGWHGQPHKVGPNCGPPDYHVSETCTRCVFIPMGM